VLDPVANPLPSKTKEGDICWVLSAALVVFEFHIPAPFVIVVPREGNTNLKVFDVDPVKVFGPVAVPPEASK
jgi:hypothetical protein